MMCTCLSITNACQSLTLNKNLLKIESINHFQIKSDSQSDRQPRQGNNVHETTKKYINIKKHIHARHQVNIGYICAQQTLLQTGKLICFHFQTSDTTRSLATAWYMKSTMASQKRKSNKFVFAQVSLCFSDQSEFVCLYFMV